MEVKRKKNRNELLKHPVYTDCVNMASESVYSSYAKSVLDTKTLTLATQDNGWLSAPPNELLTEGVVSKQAPPYPTGFDPRAWSTHPLLG